MDLDAALKLIEYLNTHGINYLDIFLLPIDSAVLDSEDGMTQGLEIIRRRLLSRNRGEVEKEIAGRLRIAKTWLQRRHEFGTLLVNAEGDSTHTVIK